MDIFKKDARSSCESHTGISLTSTVSKLLMGIIHSQLFDTREERTRENQADS